MFTILQIYVKNRVVDFFAVLKLYPSNLLSNSTSFSFCNILNSIQYLISQHQVDILQYSTDSPPLIFPEKEAPYMKIPLQPTRLYSVGISISYARTRCSVHMAYTWLPSVAQADDDHGLPRFGPLIPIYRL